MRARKEAAPWWAITKAKAAGPSSSMYARGIFEHPANFVPPPFRFVDGDGFRGVNAVTASGTRVPTDNLQLRGAVYVNGSCTRHPIREMSRASFAVVMCNSRGEEVISVTAPVWANLPQTPQASEYCAAAAAIELIGPQAVVHSDCSNVVRDMKAPFAVGTSARKVYAGVTRGARTSLNFPRLGDFVKVPAHVKITDELQGQARVRAVGNDCADRRAKEAIHCVTSSPPR